MMNRKPGRNEPCPCGSGKKYKHCCEGSAAPLRQAPSPDEINPIIELYNAGRYSEVENRARRLLDLYPDFGFGWKLLGSALQIQGQNALPAFQKAAELLPREADAHYNLGVALKGLGLLADAAASYRRALKIKPDYAEAHNNLGNVLKDFGQLDEAVDSCRRALKLKPEFAEAHFNLANILKDTGQFENALASYRQAVKLRPDYAEAHNNLAVVQRELGLFDDAMASIRMALEINPYYAEAYNNLTVVQWELELFDDAMASIRMALEINPYYAEAHCTLGVILSDTEQQDAATECYRRALQIDPECIEAMIGIGRICLQTGDFAEAEEHCQKALGINANSMEARLQLTSVRKTTAGEENFSALLAMEKAAQLGKSPMPYDEAVSLHFALGKCFDDIGDHDQAFRHYLQGCKLKRATLKYDAGQKTQYFDGIMRVFDRDTLARLQGAGNPSSVPIFVLGMPRSGTTLTEQIIASHPSVHGAGELPDLMAIAQRDITGTGGGFPDNITALDQPTLGAWAAEYAAGLRRRAPDAIHITDKMPANFLAVGLIHLMLPNAKIIHVNRNPVDTCLSCFTKPFNHGHAYSYDLAELGRYYADYARLMAHWRQVLPEGVFLEVRYEELVTDNEAQARRLIAYCGLEWNDACLKSHETKRSVRTASVTQVRQPIYTSSIERWRKYEPYLKPLLDELGDLAGTQGA
jgi:tetratricopeptide (TPR) repeat protein